MKTKYVHLSPDLKLKVLQSQAFGVEWPTLDHTNWCLHCEKKFAGRDVRLISGSRGLPYWLECGTPGCDGSPIDWAPYPWWDAKHPETMKAEKNGGGKRGQFRVIEDYEEPESEEMWDLGPIINQDTTLRLSKELEADWRKKLEAVKKEFCETSEFEKVWKLFMDTLGNDDRFIKSSSRIQDTHLHKSLTILIRDLVPSCPPLDTLGILQAPGLPVAHGLAQAEDRDFAFLFFRDLDAGLLAHLAPNGVAFIVRFRRTPNSAAPKINN